MRRRDFLCGLGSTAAAWPLTARAQKSQTPVIGFLSSASRETYAKRLEAFHRGLKETGYIEGQNVAIEYRWANNQRDLLPVFAGELVKRQVSLIVTTGGLVSATAAKKTTETIPIVFSGGADPVQLGLVASLNRPGGNVTGVSNISNELHAKRLEILRELIPGIAAIAVLVNPNGPGSEQYVKDIQVAAATTQHVIRIFNVTTEEQVHAAIAEAIALQAGALFVIADSLFTNMRDQIVTLAARHVLPASYPFREYVDAGGLMCYGPNLADSLHKTGLYAGRILKGEKPSDLPVMQPTAFELIINLKTAKALGITVPQTLLARADEVIE